MKKFQLFAIPTVCLFGLFFLIQPASASSLDQNVVNVKDINNDPNVFEAHLIADEQEVTIARQTVHALIYRDANNTTGAYTGTPNAIPVPQIIVDVGDEVIVKFTNNIDPPTCTGTVEECIRDEDIRDHCAIVECHSSIHWHGLELDNDSDGTGVTQNHVKPGESYTYRFIAPRPGVFWFHPHMKPGHQTFAGMYGAFIVRDPNETALQTAKKIPAENSTHTVVLSDIEYDTPSVGVPVGEEGTVGYVALGVTFPWAFWEDSCRDDQDGGQQQTACQTMHDGLRPLVNGRHPFNYDVSPFEENIPTITAQSGEGVRLRLVNPSVNRYFRLNVSDNGTDNNLYRIGGEGGFLEHARLEGGVLGSWDTKYDKGEIVVPASGRADVVIVPTGNPGDIITIRGENYDRGGPAGLNSNKPAGRLLQIQITGPSSSPFTIADGQEILPPGTIENLKAIPDDQLNLLSDPPDKEDGTGPEPGLTSHDIHLSVFRQFNPLLTTMLINSVVGHFEDSGDDYTQVPHQGSTRYAHGGDVLELTVRSQTQGREGSSTPHHPFHLHGFSFQPVRVIDNQTGNTLYTWDYQEFQDVIDVHHGQSLVFRVRLEDRPRITDTRQEAGAPAPNQRFSHGGVVGRWVFHCHLFLHAGLGMISELVVLDTNSPPEAQCRNVTTSTDAGVCTASGVSVDNGSSDPEDDNFTLTQDPDNPYPLGTTDVTLTATDEDGLTNSCQATVTVEDRENPSILLNGANPLTLIRFSGPYLEPGAVVGDNCDTAPVLTINGTVNTNLPGIYPVVYEVTDDHGNRSQVIRTVEVIDDPNALAHDFLLLAEKKILVDKLAQSVGNFHSNDEIHLKKGSTTFAADLTAVGKIDIAKEVTVEGDVTAGGELQLDKEVTITGTATQFASVAPVTLPALSFSASGDEIKVNENQTLPLAPGSYGKVEVEKGATLQLSTGEYFFEELLLKETANLEVDIPTGPVTVNVQKKIDIDKNLMTTLTPLGIVDSRYLTFNTLEDVQVGEGSRLVGQFIAPLGKVSLKTDVSLNGSIAAEEIDVDGDTTAIQPN